MKQFIIENMQLDITDEDEKYNSFRIKYQETAEVISCRFDNKFNVLFDDMDEIHQKCTEIVNGYLLEVVDLAIKDIISAGIYDISDNIFIEKYVAPKSTWINDFFDIDDKYMKIILNAESYEEYKKTRSGSSGSVIGGGFGAEGAITGIAIAGAANLAIGAVAGALNATADSINASNIKNEKLKLFNDANTRKHLTDSIYKLLGQVHMSVIDAILDKKGESIYRFITKKDELEAFAIFDNIKKNRFHEDEIKNHLINVIKLNPYIKDVYQYWIDKYGDANGELQNLIDFYRIKIKKIEPIANEAIDENKIFDGKVYDTVDEANEILAQYVKKFLASGKKIDDGNAKELKKIYICNPAIGNTTSICGALSLLSILIIFIHSPWWHGLIALVIVVLVGGAIENSIKKSTLKLWLREHENRLL